MRRPTVIEPVHIVVVSVCLYATEARARRATARASYARIKQDHQVGNITHRQVQFHLPDQARMSPRTLCEKGQIHAMCSGVRTYFTYSSVLAPSKSKVRTCVDAIIPGVPCLPEICC